MTADQVTDLKQFFATSLIPIDTRLDNIENRIGKLEQDIKELRQETHDGFVGVGEAIDYIHIQADKRDLLIQRLNNKWRKGQL